MASFTITLEGGKSFSCSDDQYILDAAEEQGVPAEKLSGTIQNDILKELSEARKEK